LINFYPTTILLNKFKLKHNDSVPIIGIVSRMVSQKGFDLVEEASKELMKLNAQWIILGSGEDHYEEIFRNLQLSYPDKVAVYIGFNNELSHLVEAGVDMFLMPSFYEPCGLNQIYSLKYGTVPIVRKIGGLADTVHDWFECISKGNENGTGFTFCNYDFKALLQTVKKAVDVFADKKTWKKIQTNGMKENFSWQTSAGKYLELYNDIIKKKRK
jgi:starch synthase